jgi:hypothetical protein
MMQAAWNLLMIEAQKERRMLLVALFEFNFS